MKNLLVLSTLAITVLAATSQACDTCKKDYVFGKPVTMGNGMAFAWARMDKKTKKPISIGVTLTENAISGLPTEVDKTTPMMEMALQLPEEVKGLPYDHIEIGWVPKGHEPAKIYDVPHFDIHFYTVSKAQRAKMTMQGKDLKIARKAPAGGFMAAGYINPPGTDVPNMGTHWIDPKSPEFNGSPFTTTFLYGSYNGQMTFVEPMITKAFLESKPQFEQTISSPSKTTRTGYYPTTYKISWSEARREYTISLEGLKLLKAPNLKMAKK